MLRFRISLCSNKYLLGHLVSLKSLSFHRNCHIVFLHYILSISFLFFTVRKNNFYHTDFISIFCWRGKTPILDFTCSYFLNKNILKIPSKSILTILNDMLSISCNISRNNIWFRILQKCAVFLTLYEIYDWLIKMTFY